RLAVGPWGEAKATQYVKGLSAQEPFLGKLGEMYSRLLIGEILVSVTLVDTFINTARKKGAPLAFAEGIEPVISSGFMGGVPKGAEHPNVAHLFLAFLITPEAQNIWEKYTGVSSAFIKGTKAHKYVQGKQVLYMNQGQVKEVSRLSKIYGKILGFRKK
ncbi:substrate-binding domain-containing protein, partial [Thermodesulfobacteriota bacterium]